jgi:hypothetical protein
MARRDRWQASQVASGPRVALWGFGIMAASVETSCRSIGPSTALCEAHRLAAEETRDRAGPDRHATSYTERPPGATVTRLRANVHDQPPSQSQGLWVVANLSNKLGPLRASLKVEMWVRRPSLPRPRPRILAERPPGWSPERPPGQVTGRPESDPTQPSRRRARWAWGARRGALKATTFTSSRAATLLARCVERALWLFWVRRSPLAASGRRGSPASARL